MEWSQCVGDATPGIASTSERTLEFKEWCSCFRDSVTGSETRMCTRTFKVGKICLLMSAVFFCYLALLDPHNDPAKSMLYNQATHVTHLVCLQTSIAFGRIDPASRWWLHLFMCSCASPMTPWCLVEGCVLSLSNLGSEHSEQRSRPPTRPQATWVLWLR